MADLKNTSKIEENIMQSNNLIFIQKILTNRYFLNKNTENKRHLLILAYHLYYAKPISRSLIITIFLHGLLNKCNFTNTYTTL